MIKVVNNNQPGWTNIIETDPNVTLPVGTELVIAEPVQQAYALLWTIVTDDKRLHLVRRLLLSALSKKQQQTALDAVLAARVAQPQGEKPCSGS